MSFNREKDLFYDQGAVNAPLHDGAQAGIRNKVGYTQEEFEVGKEERIHVRRDKTYSLPLLATFLND